MQATDLGQATAFEHRLARAQASSVVELPWGFAVLQDDFPFSYAHNRVVVTSGAPTAAEVLDATDQVLGAAGLRHRYVTVDDDGLGQRFEADFVAAGYEHEPIVTMIHSGADVAPAAHDVRAVALGALRPAIMRDWHVVLPEATDLVLAQLADRVALYARGADLTLLAVYDGDEVAAHAALLLDNTKPIAQFEDLVTHGNFRGRGYGGSLVSDASRRSQERGAELCFLTAARDDWPRQWYRRLGYVDGGVSHHFTRHSD